MKRNVSIQDIAQAAGVSHTTVSRALRDSPLISQPVRARIQRIADEMGYVPNAVAQSLRGERTHTIGLVVTTIADPFVGRVVRGVEAVARQHHLSLLLSVSNNDPERELEVLVNFYRRRVDGVIAAATQLGAQHSARLQRVNIPLVLINPQAETPLEQFPTVSIDDVDGARAAVQHLVSLGHRAIGYLGAGNRPRSNRARHAAYRAALEDAGLPPRAEWTQVAPPEHYTHNDDVRDGQSLLPELLEAGVTAVFCYNDMLALGALLACRALGVNVPDQLSIVGFDDVEMAQLVSPPLTTVHQPKLRLGQVAAEMLRELLAGNPAADQVLPTELVQRASTSRPPSQPARELLASRPAALRPDQLFRPSL